MTQGALLCRPSGGTSDEIDKSCCHRREGSDDSDDEEPLGYAPPQRIAEADEKRVRHDRGSPGGHGEVNKGGVQGVSEQFQTIHDN